MEHDDVGNHAALLHRAQQPLVVLPVGDVETRQIERTLRARAALPLAAPGGVVRSDGAGQDLVGGTSLHRIRVVVDIPLREDSHPELVENLALP